MLYQVLQTTCQADTSEMPLTVTRGKVHQYLGMKPYQSIDGKVQINMSD